MAGRNGLRVWSRLQASLDGRCGAASRLLSSEAGSSRAFASALPQEAIEEAPQNVKDGKVGWRSAVLLVLPTAGII